MDLAIVYLKLSERLYARLFGGAYFAAMAIGIDCGNQYCLIISIVSGAIAGTASTLGVVIWFVTPFRFTFSIRLDLIIVMALATLGSIFIRQAVF